MAHTYKHYSSSYGASSDELKDFFERERLSYDWIKTKPREYLDALCEKLECPAHFTTEPRDHQLACFLLGTRLQRFCFYLDMGTGKTKIALDLIDWWRRKGKGNALVLVPNTANVGSWIAEIKKHQPGLPVRGLGSSNTLGRPREVFSRFDGVTVMTYHGLLHAERADYEKGLPTVDSLYGVFILDESAYINKPSSKITKRLTKLCSGRNKVVYGLTGTPFSKDPIALYSQFRVVDQGQTLGSTVRVFRAAFFTPRETPWGLDWSFRKDLTDTLHNIIKNGSIRYSSDECITLPPCETTTITIPKSVKIKKYYTDFTEKLRKFTAQNQRSQAVESFQKLRQLTSGFMYVKDDNDARQAIRFDVAPKLDVLLSLIEQVPEDSKVVVFYDFQESENIIMEFLTKKKVKGLVQFSKNPNKAVQQFTDNKTTKVLLANHHSGGTGLNLQVANYIIFYESPITPAGRKQSEARCLRQGQNKHVFIYDIVMEGSVDTHIMHSLRTGRAFLDQVIDGSVDL